LSARALENRAVRITPARAAISPESAKRDVLRPATWTPE